MIKLSKIQHLKDFSICLNKSSDKLFLSEVFHSPTKAIGLAICDDTESIKVQQLIDLNFKDIGEYTINLEEEECEFIELKLVTIDFTNKLIIVEKLF